MLRKPAVGHRHYSKAGRLVTVVDSVPSPAIIPATNVPCPSVSTRSAGAEHQTRDSRPEVRMHRVNARIVHLHDHVLAVQTPYSWCRRPACQSKREGVTRGKSIGRASGDDAGRRGARRANPPAPSSSVGGITRTTGPKGELSCVDRFRPPSFSICVTVCGRLMSGNNPKVRTAFRRQMPVPPRSSGG